MMGGYLLFQIQFPSKEDRDKFESKMGYIKRLFQYDITNKMLSFECTYYPIWMGYEEPQEYIKACKRLKIKLIKFLSIDLSTTGQWYDEIKQEQYVEERTGEGVGQ